MESLSVPTEQLTLEVEKSVEIAAPAEIVFDSLIEQITASNLRPDDLPMPMKLEPWPGGRWYRDLGDSNGHLWGHVQVIKRPTLLEISGPLFMSYAAISHVQYRIVADGDGARLTVRHTALGAMPPEHGEGVTEGWAHLAQLVKRRAEAARA